MPTPADPDPVYLLDWEDPATNGAPTSPPPGWKADYNANPPPAGGVPYDRFRVVDFGRRLIRRDPLARSRWSARFELRHGEPPVSGSIRCELSDGDQQFDEGWYGFSIFLPSDVWDAPDTADERGEILVQWHHYNPTMPLAPSYGSPPLAILTRFGCWYVSQHVSASSTNPDTPIGKYGTGTWTDWVVHAVWSPSPAYGQVQVWKDGSSTPVFEMIGKTTRDPPEDHIYMKFGIYKWAWKDPIPPPGTVPKLPPPKCLPVSAPVSTNTRVVYHDELRITGPYGHRGAVTPWQPRHWWDRLLWLFRP